jgi:hypothetical protein
MKKLLLGAAIVLSASFSTKAQTPIYSEAFGTATIPTGWSQTTTAVAADKWKFTNAWGSTLADYLGTQGYMACVDDYDNNPSDIANWDTLKGPSINCTTYPNVFISLNYLFWLNQGNETVNIIYSTNGGTTWAAAASLANTNGNWVNDAIYDLSAYAGGQASVMIGFTYYNGYSTPTPDPATGMAIQDVEVYAPAAYDVQVETQNLPYLMQVGTAYTFTGLDSNLGVTGITAMNMNYYVTFNGVNSAPVSQTISGISGFGSITDYNWSMNSVPFTPGALGYYTVKYWASNLNTSNANINTDTLVAHFMAVDSIQPKTVMFEEFSCASCDPCLYAMTNIDTVSEKNAAICNTDRYHWYFPGQDMINQVTANLVNSRFETYYGQDGVPVAEIDGAYYYPGAGSLTSAVIQGEAASGSPFKIDVATAVYDPVTTTYSLSATIESYGNLAAGLTAQVILTEDSVNFLTDQSVEDPTSYFAPPIGTGTGNDDPDWMYPLVLNFPDAVEDMLPSVNGTTLSAFTSGSTQTVNVSWVQNHAWAIKNAAYPYDSTLTQHFTILVQDNNANAAAGLPAQYVFQSKKVLISGTNTTGIDGISKGVSFNMYPNPTSTNTTLAFNLEKGQNVNVQVFNMLGQQVYMDNEGMMSSGQHTILINGSSLQNGMYFVRFSTDNTATTQKLIIQK